MSISSITQPIMDSNKMTVAAELMAKPMPNLQDIPKKEETTEKPKVDTFSKSDALSSGVYSKPSQEKIQAYIQSQSNRKLVMMQSMVKQMVTSQGGKFMEAPDFSFLNKKTATIDKEAATEIAKDTAYSVDKVATTIMDFANALTKGDPSKLDEVKKGFINGFKAAERLYGGEGKLPAISYATYDEVMKRFDELAVIGDTDQRPR